MSLPDAGMAPSDPDNPEPALSVDQLRRKARRRLVGAVILALAAALVLPLLLEKDPKPLGEDVSVRIPPVDEGRFVSGLSGKSGDAPEAAGKTPPASPAPAPARTEPPPVAAAAPAAAPSVGTSTPPPKKTLADAEQRLLTPVAKPATAVAPESKPAAPPPALAAAAKAPEAKPVSPAPATAKPADPKAASTAATDGFVVQLAAYADDKGANALAGRLKKAGHAAYVEPVETSRGTLWRVRVGGFATRADADAARAKLKDQGHSGIVAKAK